jgi:hypothetical protein
MEASPKPISKTKAKKWKLLSSFYPKTKTKKLESPLKLLSKNKNKNAEA